MGRHHGDEGEAGNQDEGELARHLELKQAAVRVTHVVKSRICSEVEPIKTDHTGVFEPFPGQKNTKSHLNSTRRIVTESKPL